MEYFLERIARQLYDLHGDDLRKQCLVFPNRRAGLYFMRYLSDMIHKPVWAPASMTISEFFASFTKLHVPDSELLIGELYKAYKSLVISSGGFDDFYFWGDMLLNDFDDLDKYMADASILFRNVNDLKKIDDQFGELDKERIEIIKRFWQNFEPEKPTREKEGFISVWSILSDLYSAFRKRLRSQNYAYEGMVFRDLAEKVVTGQEAVLKWDTVNFVGFNAINRCEEVIMKWLQDTGTGRFFWDYDTSYINGGRLNSAGLFLKRNLKHFRNDMPDDWSYDTFLSSPDPSVKREIIETTSDVAQVKLIPFLLDRIPGLSPETNHHTAVILSDESLLVPLLTSLPSAIGDINITMGYPLRQTDVYTLLGHILNLQRNCFFENNNLYFDHRDVTEILKHSLVQHLFKGAGKVLDIIVSRNLLKIPSEMLENTDTAGVIFRKTESPSQLSSYLKMILFSLQSCETSVEDTDEDVPFKTKITSEFIFRILLSLNRLERIIDDPDITLNISTYIRILDNILRTQSVPFTGEPLSGIQIMGLLETRSLDFRNIIMLSVNENILPRNSSGSSFIPYSIREAFGLPTVNHQESLYAHHFYRLLHRAENVTFVYNSNSEGLITGEMSRFLLQMKYDQILKPETTTIGFKIQTNFRSSDKVERTASHSAQLSRQFLNNGSRSALSPTAINTWLNCRMRFYYRYVCGLKEADKITAEIDHAMLGQALHEVMKTLYEGFPDREITEVILDSLINNEKKLLFIINDSLRKIFGMDSAGILSGNSIITGDILLLYLIKILKTDRSLAPLMILDLEKQYLFNLPVKINGEIMVIRTGGNIDRVDRWQGITRIVDYKSGNIAGKINAIGDLFSDDRKKDLDGWLQTLLYCEAYLGHNMGTKVRPSVYKVRHLPGDENSDTLRIKGEMRGDILISDYSTVREEFMKGLTGTVEAIFSSVEPFIMTNDESKCRYCPFRGLCHR